MGGRWITQEERIAMVRLRAEGLDYKTVARRMGRSPTAVGRLLRPMESGRGWVGLRGQTMFGGSPAPGTTHVELPPEPTLAPDKEKPTCETCGRSFDRQNNLEWHRATHTDNKAGGASDFLRLVHDLIDEVDASHAKLDALRTEVTQWVSEVERLEAANAQLQAGGTAAEEDYKLLLMGALEKRGLGVLNAGDNSVSIGDNSV